jgi:hypothetical protein
LIEEGFGQICLKKGSIRRIKMASSYIAVPAMPRLPKIPWKRISIVVLIFVMGVLSLRPLVFRALSLVPVPQATIPYVQLQDVTVNAKNPIPKVFPKEGLKVRGEGKNGTVFLLKFYTFGRNCHMWFGYEKKWLWFTFEEWLSGTLSGFSYEQEERNCAAEHVIKTLEAQSKVAESELRDWLDTVIRLMKVQWRWTG